MEIKAFSIHYNDLSDVIGSLVEIYHPFREDQIGPDRGLGTFKGLAIWDTGAQVSVITQKVAGELGLQPFRFMRHKGVLREDTVPVYKIAVVLPNGFGLRTMDVSEVPELADGFDVLIGMDIIGLGDFAISKLDNKTFFSFRIPSHDCIDFTGKTKTPIPKPAVSRVGRNDPCPCGSGMKYKRCHGIGQ